MTRPLVQGTDQIQLPADSVGKRSAFIKTALGTAGQELYLPTAALVDEYGNTLSQSYYRGQNELPVSDEEANEKLELCVALLTEIALALNLIAADTRGGRQETRVASPVTTHSERILQSVA